MSKSRIAVLLSVFLAGASALAAAADNQLAGEVKALIPAASRNAATTKVSDRIEWNDLLRTDPQGRMRAGLTAGSILSLGSSSELRVVQHDSVSQQTVITMNYGKLRNQVAKITKADGKYEVRTPNAVIGVTGTDFYVGYENNRTTVICYTGSVAVTASAGAKVVKQDSSSRRDGGVIILLAGQMVVIGSETPPGGFLPVATPVDVAELSMQDTNVPEPRVEVGTVHHHRRKPLILWLVLGGAGGLGSGLAIAEMGSSGSHASTTTTTSYTEINFTNRFGTVNVTDAGLASKGSELQNYDGVQAPKGRSLGSVDFSMGAFTGSNILSGGTFSSTGSIFDLTSGPAKYGQPPKGPIFTGSFSGPVTWTLVSQPGKYTDNFTLTGPVSGTLYTGASVTGTTTQSITLYTDQWTKDHEALIKMGSGQLKVPETPVSQLNRRLAAMNRRNTAKKLFGWSIVW